MIEIIQEKAADKEETMELPRNIRQIGEPDIGDRIYIENKIYQYMHPYDTDREKTVYVLLGKFDEQKGRQSVFVEAAICLEEIGFEGDTPEWNDDSWSYLYKKLKHAYDSMVIVGWALDIRGKMPHLTIALEQLHRTYFGGAHQVLYLMDSLEKEDTFYSMKNGCLKQREGYYIYYGKEEEKQPEGKREQQEDKMVDVQEQTGDEKMKIDLTCQNEPPKSSYRAYLEEKAKKQISVPAYLMTAVLIAVIGVLGYSTISNYQKMSAMESTLKQIDQVQTAATEEQGTIQIENVAGNIQPTESEASVADQTEAISTDTGENTESTSDEADAQQNVPDTENQIQDAPVEPTMSAAQQYLSQGYYIVEKGDSLVGICRKIYQTTAMLDKLCEVNGIDNPDAIYEGQYLTLPN